MKTVTMAKTAAAGLFFGGSLLVAGAAPAAAAPTTVQDGLVNVDVGNITVAKDVNAGVAAQVAANVCGVTVGPLDILASEVDNSSTPSTVCTTPQGPVTILQN